jgi:hypothetical protein
MVAMSYVITRNYNIQECHINCPFMDIVLYVDRFATGFYMELGLLQKHSKNQKHMGYEGLGQNLTY